MRTTGVFFKIYSVFLALTLVLALAFYFLTLPWMRDALFEQEKRSARIVLNNTVEVIRSYRRELASWREQMLEARKLLLRERVRSAARLLDGLRVARLPEAQKRQTAIRLVGSLGGADNYLWLASEDYQPVYHPRFAPGASASGADTDGWGRAQGVVHSMVDLARQNQEGFIEYLWPRRPGLPEERKLAFVRYLPAWHWVMGSGLYISDIEASVADRRQQQLDEIRRLLKATPIAGSGYIYVFDGQGRMIVHPDERLEGHNVSLLKNPATGRPLASEIMEAARGSGVLSYQWNRPDDPEHYTYQKLAWVRYLPEADWYIATSVYTDELYANAEAIISRLMLIAAIAIFLLAGVAGLLARRFSAPLERMAHVARAIAGGARHERLPEDRRDEVGAFARAFNRMVERLQNALAALEDEVSARTRQLSERVQELDRRAKDERLINQMLTCLQRCETEDEVYRVLGHLLEDWAPQATGLIWRRQSTRAQDLVLAGHWGAAEPVTRRLKRRDCLVARRGEVYARDDQSREAGCDCLGKGPYAWSICLPVHEQDDVIAIVQVMFGYEGAALPEGQTPQALKERLLRIIEPLGLAMQNLHLRARLKEQSIRDGLTGLYNRRFLDDRLDSEISRCERHGEKLAILLVDIDYFKRINDTWGHPVGDRVLTKLAALMLASVRESDLVCRYGGEEFVLVLPEITEKQALARAEALRQRVAETDFVIDEEGNRLTLTLSVGVAWYPDMGPRGGQLIRAADTALYHAKRSGRNRVEVATTTAPQTRADEPDSSSLSDTVAGPDHRRV